MNQTRIYRKHAARIIGVHKDTLLKWEEKGLVEPHRDYNGWRMYELEEVLRLREMVIGEGQKAVNV